MPQHVTDSRLAVSQHVRTRCCPAPRPTRLQVVNGTRAACAKDPPRADAVVIVARGDSDDPFHGFHDIIERVAHFDRHQSWLTAAVSTDCGSAGATGSVTICREAQLTSAASSMSLPNTPRGDARTPLAAVTAAAPRGPPRLMTPHLCQQLCVKDARPSGAGFDNLRNGAGTAGSGLFELPVCVAVACDGVEESGDAVRIGRLKAMGRNWSLAHRSCVTFVSLLNGEGVATVMGRAVVAAAARAAALARMRMDPWIDV